MVFVEDVVQAHDFVSVHHDLLSIFGFHHGVFLHAHGATNFVFHRHLAIFEDVDRRAILQLNRFLDLCGN